MSNYISLNLTLRVDDVEGKNISDYYNNILTGMKVVVTNHEEAVSYPETTDFDITDISTDDAE